MAPPSDHDPKAPGVCCVLWTAANADAPAALLKVLEQRRLRVVMVRHRFEAVAQIVRAHAAMSRHTSGDPGAPKGPILVFVEPEELAGASAVFRAIELAAPGTLCWRYRQASSPKLGMFMLAELPDKEPPQPAEPPHVVVAPGVTDWVRGRALLDLPKLTLTGSEATLPSPSQGPAQDLPGKATRGSSPTPTTNPLTPKAAGDLGAIPGRSEPLRLASYKPDRVQDAGETSDHHGRDDTMHATPFRPRERDDFSRIITEDELTMLLADRDQAT